MKRKPIDDYSTDELLAEIARRASTAEREHEQKPIVQCDECDHFKPFGDAGNMPDSYNPCTRGHKMSFRMPTYENDYDYGFYRRNCADRSVPATQG